MQASYVTRAYREEVERAFCEFLLALRFVNPQSLPDIERFKQFLTRLWSTNPDIDNTTLCLHGLPEHWCYIQYTRSQLYYDDEQHEFRNYRLRTRTPDDKQFQELRFGFGYYDLRFCLVANDDTTLEACEALYYRRLYKLQAITYTYLDYEFTSRILHNVFSDFSLLPLGGEQGSGWALQWECRIEVPVLTKDIQGFTVLQTRTNIYDRSSERIAIHEPSFGVPAMPVTPEEEAQRLESLITVLSTGVTTLVTDEE